MRRSISWILAASMAVGPAMLLPQGVAAQDRRDNRGRNDEFRNGYQQQQPYNDQYDRGRYQGNDRGYNGNNGQYNNDYNRRHQGGIGPGKGALIGGGGGAALGALFGGGLKGALIGGGVGAGGGALIGKAVQNRRYNNQDNRYGNNGNRDYRDRYDQNGRPR